MWIPRNFNGESYFKTLNEVHKKIFYMLIHPKGQFVWSFRQTWLTWKQHYVVVGGGDSFEHLHY